MGVFAGAGRLVTLCQYAESDFETITNIKLH